MFQEILQGGSGGSDVEYAEYNSISNNFSHTFEFVPSQIEVIIYKSGYIPFQYAFLKDELQDTVLATSNRVITYNKDTFSAISLNGKTVTIDLATGDLIGGTAKIFGIK